MKLEDQRTETPFAARDNMLTIWDHCTELSYRRFGKKKRKMPKEPRNFHEWSEESRVRWIQQQQEHVKQQEIFDNQFVARETNVVDSICREIVFLVDAANSIEPQYIAECDDQRLTQNKAIRRCNNLKRELNHIMNSIPSNKNFIVKLQKDIDDEINILRGWRQSCNKTRIEVIQKEIKQRRTIAEKMGFVFCLEENRGKPETK